MVDLVGVDAVRNVSGSIVSDIPAVTHTHTHRQTETVTILMGLDYYRNIIIS